jgi:hypothetical protein
MTVEYTIEQFIEELRHCLYPEFPVKIGEGFTRWLLSSNNPKVGPYLGEERFTNMRIYVEGESLRDILDILLREPQADYFWYTYRENGGRLTYSLPHSDVVPANALRVDKEKIKIFLRDIKIETILQ